MQKKKKRIFYLDFIRAIATLSIVLTHYNAQFLYLSEPAPEKCILTLYAFNLYTGAWGVSLFFIISGAALMHVYENSFSLKEFYTKRILGIYPMLWLAFIAAVSYYLLRWKTYNPWGVLPQDGWKILLSVFGVDQYVSPFMSTFSLVGEWFLGCIILMYIVFPILRKIVLSPKLCFAFIPMLLVLYVFGLYNHMTLLPTYSRLLVRVPEFMFGMVFMRYKSEIGKILLGVLGGLAGLILILNQVLKPQFSSDIQTTYVGIASFVIFVLLAALFEKSGITNYFVKKICKYSYAIYLTHHFIIREVSKIIDFSSMSNMTNYMVFFVTCELILMASILLSKLYQKFVEECREIRCFRRGGGQNPMPADK